MFQCAAKIHATVLALKVMSHFLVRVRQLEDKRGTSLGPRHHRAWQQLLLIRVPVLFHAGDKCLPPAPLRVLLFFFALVCGPLAARPRRQVGAQLAGLEIEALLQNKLREEACARIHAAHEANWLLPGHLHLM